MAYVVVDYGSSGSSGAGGITTSGNSNSMTSISQQQNKAVATSLSGGLKFGTTIFNPRLKAPDDDDKCWISTQYGGYNPSILIYGRSCLPNCVRYAWGRMYEISKQYNTALPSTGYPWIWSAKWWWIENPNYSHYATGNIPRLGAICCYNGINGNTAGHVAVVEKINYNAERTRITSVILSESSYYTGKDAATREKKKFHTIEVYPNRQYNYYSDCKFQGFLYPPYTALFAPDAGSEYTDGKTVQEAITLNITTVAVRQEDGSYSYEQGAVSSYVESLPGIPADREVPPIPELDLTPGIQVKVIGPGNSSKLGTGKEVDVMGKNFIIKSTHLGFTYPYRVGTETRGIGYFTRDSLEPLSNPIIPM